MKKTNEELIQIVKEHPEKAGEVMEQLRDAVDGKRADYNKAANEYAQSVQSEQQKAAAKLYEIRQKIRTCSDELENAEKLRPVAVMSGDAKALVDHEQQIARLSAELEQLKANETAVQAYVVTGDADLFAAVEQADKALADATDAARFARFEIADILENKIEDLRESMKKAADGIPQNVVIPAELNFGRMESQRNSGRTVSQMEAERVESEAEAKAREEALKRQRELWPELYGETKQEPQKKPIYKSVMTPDRGEVRYKLNEETGEYEEVFDGARIEKPRHRSYSGI